VMNSGKGGNHMKFFLTWLHRARRRRRPRLVQ
jgi:hypothetical protein